MEKRDAGKIKAQAKEAMRPQAVKQPLKGKTNTQIAEVLEISRRTVSVWLTHYKRDGIQVFKGRTVCCKMDSGLPLSSCEQHQLRHKIQDKHSEEVK